MLGKITTLDGIEHIILLWRGTTKGTRQQKKPHFLQHMEKYTNNDSYIYRSSREGKKVCFTAVFPNTTRKITSLHTAEMTAQKNSKRNLQ